MYCASLEANEDHQKEEYLSAKSRQVEPALLRSVVPRIYTPYLHLGQV